MSSGLDLGRELQLGGGRYDVTEFNSDASFFPDWPLQRAADENAAYGGNSPIGPPWIVNVPTALIVLPESVADWTVL